MIVRDLVSEVFLRKFSGLSFDSDASPLSAPGTKQLKLSCIMFLLMLSIAV